MSDIWLKMREWWADRQGARRWSEGPARRPTKAELAELKARLPAPREPLPSEELRPFVADVHEFLDRLERERRG